MGSGFRTFASGEVLTSSNVQNYLMDQAVMVFSGTAARSSALPSPEVGMTAYSTATGLQVYNGSAWVNVGGGYGVATGGSGTASRTIGGENYTVLTFTSDSNLVVTTAGLFDVLLVGGGGVGGAGGVNIGGGGGGAGALVGFASTTTIYLAAGTVAVDIGAGGPGSSPGKASYIGSVISACGGGNGGDYVQPFERGGNGGSGGGAGNGWQYEGFSVDDTFGNNGGKGDGVAATHGGGGGGYGSAGGNGSGTTGGSGGNGVDVSSWGTSGSTDNVAAGGGGGGTVTGGAAGTGGVAGKTSGTGNAATTAGSGGGGTVNGAGGAGAAGKVWVRFKV